MRVRFAGSKTGEKCQQGVWGINEAGVVRGELEVGQDLKGCAELVSNRATGNWQGPSSHGPTNALNWVSSDLKEYFSNSAKVSGTGEEAEGLICNPLAHK